MTNPPPFDITAPLPTAAMLVEASAGTGKTWTIAALAARFVAEEALPVGKLLVITFSAAAAAQLRTRIFERMGTVAAQLQDLLRGAEPPQLADPVAGHLARLARPQRFVDRLLRAREEFEQATITTIHSFCQTQLSQLGVLGDWDGDDQVLADTTALLREATHDEYLARYLHHPASDDANRSLRLAMTAGASDLPLRSTRPEQAHFVAAVRERFAKRRRELSVVNFDDLPQRLDQLTQRSAEACRELRRRFPVVLVDEFQDTDPAQWRILKRVFVEGDSCIVLVGDPKQSIYGFRSADLGCYAEAKAMIGQQACLDINFRSEPGVTAGVAELFGNLDLGLGTTLYPLRAGYPASSPRLELGTTSRLWLRLAGPSGDPLITADLIHCISRLLGSQTLTEGQSKTLLPSDIAVLTRTRERGLALVTALNRAGIPASWRGGGTLGERTVADWVRVLTAISDPTRSNVLAAALGDLLGIPIQELLTGGDESRASQRIHALAQLHTGSGLAAVITELLAGLEARLRAADGIDRAFELRQLGHHLLAVGATDAASAVAALTNQAELPCENHPESAGVHVATMHSAKGLEFPVVLLPQVSLTEINLNGAITYVAEDQRVIYVGDRPGYRDELTLQARQQARLEELRLLYVGLTRARHLAVAWHSNTKRSSAGPLTALLARDRTRPTLEREYPQLPRQFPFDPSLVHVSRIQGPARPDPFPQPPKPTVKLAQFTRSVDPSWRRTSYSGLTSGLHEHAPDEPELSLIPTDLEGPLAQPSLMNALPSGAGFGTLVHEILEACDWGQPGHLREVTNALAPRFGLDEESTAQLAHALDAVTTTPLGGIFEGSLSEIPISDRLPELDFDLPLGGASRCRVTDLAEAMAAHLEAKDPLFDYPRRLRDSEAAQAVLAGFLTGSIDAVLRVPRGFVVVDYKTNRLPTLPEQELALGHYSPRAMAEAMMQAHYPLQAILYCAALHRYLGWRQPGYDPEVHLGGVGYLFVRAMAGPLTPAQNGQRCGVFEWYPPAALVIEISNLLGGRRG